MAKVALVVAEDGKKWELNLTGTAGSSNARRSITDAIKGVPSDANTLSIAAKLIIPITSLAPEAEVVNAKRNLTTSELNLEEARQTVRLDTQDICARRCRQLPATAIGRCRPGAGRKTTRN